MHYIQSNGIDFILQLMNKATVKYNFNLFSTIFPLKEKKYFNLLSSFLVSLIIPIPILNAADFQKGFQAHLKGDYISAIKEWGPLAAQGDAAAQFNIGNMFDFGKGVAEDNAQAVYWYNKSAEQGNANAQYALGWMYENGEGVVKDLAMAFKWYKRSAERNHPAYHYDRQLKMFLRIQPFFLPLQLSHPGIVQVLFHLLSAMRLMSLYVFQTVQA